MIYDARGKYLSLVVALKSYVLDRGAPDKRHFYVLCVLNNPLPTMKIPRLMPNSII
jgi:hypothetical protein